MGVEFHVRKLVLEKLVLSKTQEKLNSTCIPPLGPAYIDHLNATHVQVYPGDSDVYCDVAIDIFVVGRASLEPDGVGTKVPPGALTPIQAPSLAKITLRLILAGTSLSMVCTNVHPPTPEFGDAAQQIADSINAGGPIGAIDFADIFSTIGLPSPGSSRVVNLDGVLVFAFDARSPSPRLPDGQDWGILVDCPTLSAVAHQKFDPFLPQIRKKLNEVSLTLDCLPNASMQGRIRGNYTLEVPILPDPKYWVNVYLTISFSMIRAVRDRKPAADLNTRVHWNVDAGIGVVDKIVDGIVAPYFDASKLHATKIDDHTFVYTNSLAQLGFGGASFEYRSFIPVEKGAFLLGGTVTGIPAQDTSIFDPEVHPFSNKYPVELNCGVGTPAPIQVIGSTYAYSLGRLCDIQVLSPPPNEFDLSPYLSRTDGTVTINPVVGKALHDLGKPVKLLIKTTRGVRIVNYGIPPDPVFGPTGQVTNSFTFLGDGCVRRWYQLDPRYKLYPILAALQDLVDPPPYEGYRGRLGDVARFQSVLTQVRTAGARDVVTLDQPLDGGRAVFSAASTGAGEIVVPMVVPQRRFDAGIKLQRMSLAPVGDVVTQAKTFHRVATLQTPGALSHALSADADGAVVTTHFKSHVQSVRIDSLGLVRTLGTRKAGQAKLPWEVSVPLIDEDMISSPSPSSTDSDATTNSIDAAKDGTATQEPTQFRHAPKDGRAAWRCCEALPGLKTVHLVPGFEMANVAIAELEDGTYRSVAKDVDGKVLVTGELPAWPSFPPTAGSWGVSGTEGRQISVYAVVDLGTEGKKGCGCGCEKGEIAGGEK